MWCGCKRADVMLMRVVLSRILLDRLAIRAKYDLDRTRTSRLVSNGYYATTGYNLVTGRGVAQGQSRDRRYSGRQRRVRRVCHGAGNHIDPSPSGWRNKLAV